MTSKPIRNRVTEMTGTDYPIVQAPMGWIARAQLASAGSNADFVIEQGIKFVTTSSGSPKVCTQAFQEAGIKVFHVVPTLEMALKAIDCGVDGLVVEGGEGGGFKNPTPVSSMVLLPLIRSRVDVPIIAAGGMCDGLSMAGAFAMGAEGIQMGTRMLCCSDSPVHANWKDAVITAKETDTVFLNQQSRPALRALRTARTAELALLGKFDMVEHMANLQALYFGGDMEAAIPLSGQVAGRINAILSAGEIIEQTVAEFDGIMQGLAKQYTC